MGWHNRNAGQQSPKEVKMWKVGIGSPKQKIDEEVAGTAGASVRKPIG